MSFPGFRIADRRQGIKRLLLWLFLFAILAPLAAYRAIHGGQRPTADMPILTPRDLGNFPLDRTTGSLQNVPEKWHKLEGQSVEFQGLMCAPDASSDRVDHFQFVDASELHEHNAPPLVQNRIFVTVPHGTVPLRPELVTIKGTLHVKIERDGGDGITSVYRLDLGEVVP